MMLLHKMIIKTINDICYIYVGSILFTLRRISRLSLVLSMLGCMDGQTVFVSVYGWADSFCLCLWTGRQFLSLFMDGQTVFVSVYGWADSFCLCLWMGRQFLPRTETYHQSKLYANCQSFFYDSGPDRQKVIGVWNSILEMGLKSANFLISVSGWQCRLYAD